MIEKTCKECGEKFMTAFKIKDYCSTKCADKSKRRRDKQKASK